jgi:hypothetical protein
MVEETWKLHDFQVLYFIFQNGDLKTSVPLEMIASLTYQFVTSGVESERLMNILKEGTKVHRDGLTDQVRHFREVCSLFMEMLRGLEYPMKMIILIDAFDECTEPSEVARNLLLPCVTGESTNRNDRSPRSATRV